MFDAPSYRAREVETRADDEAPGSGRAYVDTEHLLLALPNDADARSARSLEAVGAGDVAGLRDETVTSAPLILSEQEAPGLACLDAGKLLGGSVLLESLLPGRIRVGRRIAVRAVLDLGVRTVGICREAGRRLRGHGDEVGET